MFVHVLIKLRPLSLVGPCLLADVKFNDVVKWNHQIAVITSVDVWFKLQFLHNRSMHHL